MNKLLIYISFLTLTHNHNLLAQFDVHYNVITDSIGHTTHVDMVDWNGDGFEDIIHLNAFDEELWLYQNDGENNFNEKTSILNICELYDDFYRTLQYNTPTYNLRNYSFLKVLDVNDDGYLDILVSAHYRTLLFLNNENQNFSLEIEMAPFDSEKRPFTDVTLNNEVLYYIQRTNYYSTNIYPIMYNTNTGEVNSQNLNCNCVAMFNAQFADINNDGFEDIVYATTDSINTETSQYPVYFSEYGSMYYMPNYGGSFGQPILIADNVGNQGHYALGDLDSDGDTDFLITKFEGDEVLIIENNEPTFNVTNITSSIEQFINIQNFQAPQIINNQGDTYLSFGKKFDTNDFFTKLTGITILQYPFTASPPMQTEIVTEDYIYNVFIKDFNNDGNLDVFTPPNKKEFALRYWTIFDNVFSGETKQLPTSKMGNNNWHFGDYNNDGIIDLVNYSKHITNNVNINQLYQISSNIYIGNTSSGFDYLKSNVIKTVEYIKNFNLQFDFNNDGAQDIIQALDNNLYVVLGNSNTNLLFTDTLFISEVSPFFALDVLDNDLYLINDEGVLQKFSYNQATENISIQEIHNFNYPLYYIRYLKVENATDFKIYQSSGNFFPPTSSFTTIIHKIENLELVDTIILSEAWKYVDYNQMENEYGYLDFHYQFDCNNGTQYYYKNIGDSLYRIDNPYYNQCTTLKCSVNNDNLYDLVKIVQPYVYVAEQLPNDLGFTPFYHAMSLDSTVCNTPNFSKVIPISVDINGDKLYDIFLYDEQASTVSYMLSNATPTMSIGSFWDIDGNGNIDGGEPLLQLPLEISGNSEQLFADMGFIRFEHSPGTYQIQGSPPSTLWQCADSSLLTQNVGFLVQNQTVWLPFNPTTDIPLGYIQHTSSPIICNNQSTHWLTLGNWGTQFNSGYLSLTIDSLCQFISSTPAPDSIINNTVYWSYSNLPPTHTQNISLSIQNPSEQFIGEQVGFNAILTILNEAGDVIYSTKDYKEYEVVCSYDPNDKLVSPIGVGNENYVFKGDSLHYTIRFQNTGNYPAQDILIIDTLSTLYNWNTFTVTASSFPVKSSFDYETGIAQFFFENIYLPDSVSNEPQSHGFISFYILANQNIDNYTELSNKAEIYFDNNPPIVTNFATITLVDSVSMQQILPIELLHFNCNKQQKFNLIDWTTASEINTDYFVIQKSTDGFRFQNLVNINAKGGNFKQSYQYTDYGIYQPNTYYRLVEVCQNGQQKIVSKIELINREIQNTSYKILNIEGKTINNPNPPTGIYFKQYPNGFIQKIFNY